MALSIKGEEADKLAREIVALTGESITDAVTEALRLRVEQIKKDNDREKVLREIRAMAKENRQRMLESGVIITSTDVDDLYDEFGAPK